MGGGWSAAQMGQHSPNGISGLGQSFSSSQTISSHRMEPVSHTQMRQGSGFHTSLSLWRSPSCMQLKTSSVREATQRGRQLGLKKTIETPVLQKIHYFFFFFFLLTQIATHVPHLQFKVENKQWTSCTSIYCSKKYPNPVKIGPINFKYF